MTFVRAGATAPPQKIVQLSLEQKEGKNNGDFWLRAVHPETGKKHRVLSIRNGGAFGTATIELHPGCEGLGFSIDGDDGHVEVEYKDPS